MAGIKQVTGRAVALEDEMDSFDGSTPVLTAHGHTKPIEQITLNDKVTATDPTTIIANSHTKTKLDNTRLGRITSQPCPTSRKIAAVTNGASADASPRTSDPSCTRCPVLIASQPTCPAAASTLFRRRSIRRSSTPRPSRT